MVIKFPKPPTGSPSGPRPIYVCAPSTDDMVRTKKKFGLGYTKQEAIVAFYGGDPQSLQIATRLFTLSTAYGALKFHIVHQLAIFVGNSQPLNEVETDTQDRLGMNPYIYASKPPRAPKRKRLDKLFG
jgi:hypothetical protein